MWRKAEEVFVCYDSSEACGERDHLLEVKEIPKAGEHLL